MPTTLEVQGILLLQETSPQINKINKIINKIIALCLKEKEQDHQKGSQEGSPRGHPRIQVNPKKRRHCFRVLTLCPANRVPGVA